MHFIPCQFTRPTPAFSFCRLFLCWLGYNWTCTALWASCRLLIKVFSVLEMHLISLLLLKLAICNDLVLTNSFIITVSRRWTQRIPMQNTTIKLITFKRGSGFQSVVNRTRDFPGADINSDHDLLMMTVHLRLKRISKPQHTRLKFTSQSRKIC